MRSIERRFNYIATRNPLWSSYVCFAEAIKRQRFSRQAIHRWFLKLVKKDDYDPQDKKAILAHLENRSSWPEDNQKSTQTSD
ncbi:MAG: hypothetical protein AAB849_01985 [Patescibacteria group bacterium]